MDKKKYMRVSRSGLRSISVASAAFIFGLAATSLPYQDMPQKISLDFASSANGIERASEGHHYVLAQESPPIEPIIINPAPQIFEQNVDYEAIRAEIEDAIKGQDILWRHDPRQERHVPRGVMGAQILLP